MAAHWDEATGENLVDTFEMAEARLDALVPAFRDAPHDLARLFGVAFHLGLADALPLLAHRLGDDVAAVRAILDALAAAGEGKLVGRVLPSPRGDGPLPSSLVADRTYAPLGG